MGYGRRILAMLMVFSLGTAVGAADPAYPIQVRRRAHAGDVFDVHLVFEQTRSETAAAPAAPLAHAIKADLTCHVEVIDVTYQGQTSVRVTVGKFISVPDNKDMAAAGRVIGVQSNGLDAYLALGGGAELTEDARTVLRHVHPLGYQLDETSFGTATPRRAGESWNVDALSVSQIDSDAFFQIDPKSVQGKVTFTGMEKAGSASALRLTVDMAYTGQDRYTRTSGEKIEHQDCKTQISALLPADPALPPLELQITTDATEAITRQAAGQVKETKVEIKTHTSEKQTISPVAK